MNRYVLYIMGPDYDVSYFETLEEAVKYIKEFREEVEDINGIDGIFRYRLIEEVVITDHTI